jgi:DNA invertase Pin-like site-specific DNA recombinase
MARRSPDLMPDLFSASVTAKPAERPAVQPPKVEPDSSHSRPRYSLPKDLAGSLARLDDAEIDALLAAVSAEANRRGRLTPTAPKHAPTVDRPAQARDIVDDEGARLLNKGKLNAVRAAFKAGVKPSTIARQFGISKSDVRKVIASETRDRKSRR